MVKAKKRKRRRVVGPHHRHECDCPICRASPFNESGDEFVRIPGLLRRWELERVLEPGKDYHLEKAGKAGDGSPLYAVFRRESGT